MNNIHQWLYFYREFQNTDCYQIHCPNVGTGRKECAMCIRNSVWNKECQLSKFIELVNLLEEV